MSLLILSVVSCQSLKEKNNICLWFEPITLTEREIGVKIDTQEGIIKLEELLSIAIGDELYKIYNLYSYEKKMNILSNFNKSISITDTTARLINNNNQEWKFNCK